MESSGDMISPFDWAQDKLYEMFANRTFNNPLNNVPCCEKGEKPTVRFRRDGELFPNDKPYFVVYTRELSYILGAKDALADKENWRYILRLIVELLTPSEDEEGGRLVFNVVVCSHYFPEELVNITRRVVEACKAEFIG